MVQIPRRLYFRYSPPQHKDQLCLDPVPWVDPVLCAKSEPGAGLLNNLTVNIVPGRASREYKEMC